VPLGLSLPEVPLSGPGCLIPVFNVLCSVHATPQEMNDVIMRVALSYAAAGATEVQA